MHLEIRKRGKKKRFYLAHSFREGGKVRKIRRYLGINLTKEKIQELKKRAEKIIEEQIKIYKKIRDPLKIVLSSKEIEQVKRLEVKGGIKIMHLSQKDWKKFIESFVYDTNAIEGSTLTSNEVKSIIEKNQWPEDAKKWEISETYGLTEAVNYIRKIKTHISVLLIKKLHKIVFKNSKSFAGELRKKGIEVCIKNRFGEIVHRGAPSRSVKSLLNELVEWYNKNKNKYPPLLLAAVIHNQFENIHPFQDGNGRVGRLLLNNILLKHKIPPVNIEVENRYDYYSALQAYQNEGNIRPMIELLLKEYKLLKKQLKG